MTAFRAFLKGYLIGLLIIILANILAAHLLSDSGVSALLGTDSCADDIARAGFALVFFEEGGFAECWVEKIKPRYGTKIIKMPEL